jgi:hypothetical protein
MTFRVLRACGSDLARWQETLARFPSRSRDLHYLPEYGLVYRDSYGHEPLLAVYEEGGACVMHAFVRRSLDALPFLAAAPPAGFADIATPYGFGGPLVSQSDAGDRLQRLRAFDAAFRGWCREEHLASEFACLHPLLGNAAAVAASGVVPVQRAKEVVVIDLQQPEEALWSAVSRGTRSSIQRARREGVSIERVVPDAGALDVFRRLYQATMERRNAAARWFFPSSYFADCVRRLGPERSPLFFAYCEGEVAAAYLLLHDGQTAYYHFGGSNERWLARRPNNLLMYETMLWARRSGLGRYHLGGGVGASGNDSLLRFKSSFGGCRALLYTYCRVLDEEVYRVLCERKLRYEQRVGETVADMEYFPLYRR